MSRSRLIPSLIVTVGVVCSLGIFGCHNDAAPKDTPQEVKNFKGGPMPPEARKIMMEKLKEAAAKAPPPPNSAGPK